MYAMSRLNRSVRVIDECIQVNQWLRLDVGEFAANQPVRPRRRRGAGSTWSLRQSDIDRRDIPPKRLLHCRRKKRLSGTGNSFRFDKDRGARIEEHILMVFKVLYDRSRIR